MELKRLLRPIRIRPRTREVYRICPACERALLPEKGDAVAVSVGGRLVTAHSGCVIDGAFASAQKTLGTGKENQTIGSMAGTIPGWLVYFQYPSPNAGDSAVAQIFLGCLTVSGRGKEADLDRAKAQWPRRADRLFLVSNLYPD